MIRLFYWELEKLRTIGLPYALLGVSTVITLLIALLKATRAGTGSGSRLGGPSLATASGLTGVISTSDWAMIFALVFGVTVATGEFRHSTATVSFLAVPNRVRVLVAKVMAGAAAGLLFGVAAAAVAIGMALLFATSKGYGIALGGGTIARYAAGYIVGCALMVAVGASIGMLIRSQLAGIIAVFAWALIIEGILDDEFNSLAPYLPFSAARSLTGEALAGNSMPLPFAAAAGLVAAVAIAIGLVAAQVTLPRDV
jgi:ABC-2 type transport system permease protein